MKMMVGRHVALILCVVAVMGTSCSIFRHNDKAPVEEVQAGVVEPEATVEDHKAELLALTEKRIQTANRGAEEMSGKVIHKKPYYYREYSLYPEDAGEIKVDVQERDSRTSPLIADVTMPKQRFATRLHRKRVEAEKDESFLRDTGVETVTYDLRGGKWVRVGSLFVAEKTEEKVDGEWQPVKEVVKRTVATEEEREGGGWLKRAWSAVTGQ